MAADTTYPLGGQGIQRRQGGKESVIGSSGTLTAESGGEINIDSGGVLSLDDGGHLSLPVTVMTTSSGTITNFGITTFGTTIANAYTLAAPSRAGLFKVLMSTIHGATTVNQVITTDSTATTIVGTSSPVGTILRTLTFTNAGQCVQLVSASTSAWLLIGNVNTVAITS